MVRSLRGFGCGVLNCVVYACVNNVAALIVWLCWCWRWVCGLFGICDTLQGLVVLLLDFRFWCGWFWVLECCGFPWCWF